MRLEGAGPGEQGGTSSSIRSFWLLEASFRFHLDVSFVLSSCFWFLTLTLHYCQMANRLIL